MPSHLAKFAAALLLFAAATPATQAQDLPKQDLPNKPIHIVIAFPPGGPTDFVGRLVADKVKDILKQTILIENKPGANGAIGADYVAKAEPDGTTLFLTTLGAVGVTPHMRSDVRYDTLKDFAPVIPIGIQPVVLIVAPSKGFKTVADLVAAAKANPGAMNFASAGIGSTSHMGAERFRHAAGFQAQHIPFRGPAEAFAEVMSGRIDFYFLPLAPALALVKQGKVIALAVGAEQRSPDLPDVPTMAEAGLPDASYHFWGGIFAPAKTPREIIRRLHDETAKALEVPEVRERLAKTATGPMPMSTEQFTRYFQDDVASTVKLAKDVGIQPPN